MIWHQGVAKGRIAVDDYINPPRAETTGPRLREMPRRMQVAALHPVNRGGLQHLQPNHSLGL
eukprot:1748770-Lingulodinium_polyedra.AAC.1